MDIPWLWAWRDATNLLNNLVMVLGEHTVMLEQKHPHQMHTGGVQRQEHQKAALVDEYKQCAVLF